MTSTAPSSPPDAFAPTPTTRVLTWCLHLLVAGLLVLTVVHAAAAGGPRAVATVAVSVLMGAVYAVGPLLPRVRASRRAAALWLACTGAVWVALLFLTADAVWLAFPLYFLQLHLLPRRPGLVAVVATAVASSVAFALHRDTFAFGVVAGPALGGAVAIAVVWGYQALYRESERRRALIEELTATRADLARAQHDAGVLAERERLAREIHDTLAQGLASIQLLLRAAGRSLPAAPDTAAGYVDQARQAAADNLAEARRFVTALTPPALEGTTLAGALERLCATTADRHRLDVRFAVAGTPVLLPTAQEVALLRVAQSALSNTVLHADASRAEVALAYTADGVRVRVADDGSGFVAGGGEGFGLTAMRARLKDLGGTLDVDSAPGRGTVLTAHVPGPGDDGQAGTETEPDSLRPRKAEPQAADAKATT